MSAEDPSVPASAPAPSQPSSPATSQASATVPPGDLVVVGSSAGGVEALSTLVATLPETFPAPIVLAQHLERSRVSHLGSILQARTSLQVVGKGSVFTIQLPLIMTNAYAVEGGPTPE